MDSVTHELDFQLSDVDIESSEIEGIMIDVDTGTGRVFSSVEYAESRKLNIYLRTTARKAAE